MFTRSDLERDLLVVSHDANGFSVDAYRVAPNRVSIVMYPLNSE